MMQQQQQIVRTTISTLLSSRSSKYCTCFRTSSSATTFTSYSTTTARTTAAISGFVWHHYNSRQCSRTISSFHNHHLVRMVMLSLQYYTVPTMATISLLPLQYMDFRYYSQRQRHVSTTSSSSSTTSTTTTGGISEKDIEERLEIFHDLCVVARDCMDDLLHLMDQSIENKKKKNHTTGNSNDTDIDEDEIDEMIEQNIHFTKDAVQTAITELHSILQQIPNVEDQKRILRVHGMKIQKLQGELNLLLRNPNDDNDDTNQDDNDEEDDDDDIDYNKK